MPDRAPSFSTLAAGPCAAPGEILIVIAAELEPTDRVVARERLDDLGRALFGAAQLGLGDQVDRLGAVLDAETGLRAAAAKPSSTCSSRACSPMAAATPSCSPRSPSRRRDGQVCAPRRSPRPPAGTRDSLPGSIARAELRERVS